MFRRISIHRSIGTGNVLIQFGVLAPIRLFHLFVLTWDIVIILVRQRNRRCLLASLLLLLLVFVVIFNCRWLLLSSSLLLCVQFNPFLCSPLQTDVRETFVQYPFVYIVECSDMWPKSFHMFHFRANLSETTLLVLANVDLCSMIRWIPENPLNYILQAIISRSRIALLIPPNKVGTKSW